MRIRSRVRCERCKTFIEVGQRGVRIYGRIWHLGCAHDYAAARRNRTRSAA